MYLGRNAREKKRALHGGFILPWNAFHLFS